MQSNEDNQEELIRDEKDIIQETKIKTKTDIDQEEVQIDVESIFNREKFTTSTAKDFKDEVIFYKDSHFNFAKNLLYVIPSHYTSLDSGMPWFPFWILNITEMCKGDNELSIDDKLKIVDMIKELQDPQGAFIGNTKGLPHLVASYAAMMAIVNLGIKEAYEIIDITKMKQFLLKMKNNNFEINKEPSYEDKNGEFLINRFEKDKCSTFSGTYPGAFSGHYNGECDLRTTYCALVIATILDIMDDELTKGIVENIKKCQSYEGGFSPEPFCEAHGGYSYCAIASLIMLNKLHEIDLDSFLRWLVNRQMTIEGGFNGRANKLVDSCYSFWQGSIFKLLYMGDTKFSYDNEMLYDQLSLQAYILFCCQREVRGGLRDKPGRSPDLYHTNYAIAGLLLSQESFKEQCKVFLSKSNNTDYEVFNPIYCAFDYKVKEAKKYYKGLKKRIK